MKLLTILNASLFLGVLTFSMVSLAEDDIILPPGGRITVLNTPTTVLCEAPDFKRYCKCGSSGFSGQEVLEIVLDDQGTSDELGVYDSRAVCETSLKNHPSCNK